MHPAEADVALAPASDVVPHAHQPNGGKLALAVNNKYRHVSITRDALHAELALWRLRRAGAAVESTLDELRAIVPQEGPLDGATPGLNKAARHNVFFVAGAGLGRVSGVTRLTRLARIGDLPLRPAELERLTALAGSALAEAGPDTEIALISTATTLTEDDLVHLPALRHVALCGTSYGHIDRDALQRRGITTSNVADYSDETTAEVIFMQLVAVARGFAEYQWRPESHELFGKRLLIVGLGALGSAVANLGLAYGMHVRHLSRSPKPRWEANGVLRADRATAFAAADVVVLTGPTGRVLVTADDLAQLNDAILLQASGGRVIEDAAFRDWITRGHNVAIFDLAAGEDVYSDYAHLPRVIFPRAISGLCDESLQRLGEHVIANVTTAMNPA